MQESWEGPSRRLDPRPALPAESRSGSQRLVTWHRPPSRHGSATTSRSGKQCCPPPDTRIHSHCRDRGPSERCGQAPHPRPVGLVRVGARSVQPPLLAPSRPPRHRAEHSPVPNPLPQMGSPSRPQVLGGPESFSGIETAHLGSSHSRLYSGASRAGAALAHSATPPPPSTPKAPSPDRESLLSGGYGRGGHSPAAPAGAGSISTPFGDRPASDGTQTRTRPHCARACWSRLHLRQPLSEPPQGLECGEGVGYKSSLDKCGSVQITGLYS